MSVSPKSAWYGTLIAYVRYESSLRDTPERSRVKGKRNLVSDVRFLYYNAIRFYNLKTFTLPCLLYSITFPTLLSSIFNLLFSTLHLFSSSIRSSTLLYSFTYFYLFLHLLLVRQGRVIRSKAFSLHLNIWISIFDSTFIYTLDILYYFILFFLFLAISDRPFFDFFVTTISRLSFLLFFP